METSSTRLSFLILAASLIALFGSSYRTVDGFGRDVQHTGENIKEASRR